MERIKKGLYPNSLNRRILLFLVLCWLIPVLVFFVFTTEYYKESIVKKAENLMEKELENIAGISAIRIEEAINLCQKPSYERTWEKNWESFRKEEMNHTDYLRTINSSLKGKFYLDERFLSYAYYEDGSFKPDCYGSRVGITYQDYVDSAQSGINEIIDSDSSYTMVRVINERLYIVRNLFTTMGYERFGTLVVELDPKEFFTQLPSGFEHNIRIILQEKEGTIDFYQEDTSQEEQELIKELVSTYENKGRTKIERKKSGKYNGYLYQEKFEYYTIGIASTIEQKDIYQGLYKVYQIMVVMIFLFLPLVAFGVWFLREQIQLPIRKLVVAAKKMEEGEMGIWVKEEEMPNQEFIDLGISFNNMSSQVRYLFDTVYNEKLARKDAQIVALQAQMNPHFLNNTLEMMNWQARMSNDLVVSKMIEALGIVMDYMMNRLEVKMIHLSEELRCTDAYLYIMTMRFGQRLKIEKNIQQDILQVDVPPLILQPIVENAIVHGIEKAKNGCVCLKIYKEETKLYLQVINTGKIPNKEQIQKLQALLAGDDTAIPRATGHHTSIGIKNVNKRIRLMYGEEYGLSIFVSEEGKTVSTITLPYKEANLLNKIRDNTKDD